jgi:hypothetical protein
VHSPLGRPGSSVDEVASADAGYLPQPRSRLVRLNDAALITLLVVPQLIWLGLVVYLLHRNA